MKNFTGMSDTPNVKPNQEHMSEEEFARFTRMQEYNDDLGTHLRKSMEMRDKYQNWLQDKLENIPDDATVSERAKLYAQYANEAEAMINAAEDEIDKMPIRHVDEFRLSPEQVANF